MDAFEKRLHQREIMVYVYLDDMQTTAPTPTNLTKHLNLVVCLITSCSKKSKGKSAEALPTGTEFRVSDQFFRNITASFP